MKTTSGVPCRLDEIVSSLFQFPESLFGVYADASFQSPRSAGYIIVRTRLRLLRPIIGNLSEDILVGQIIYCGNSDKWRMVLAGELGKESLIC